MALKAKQHFLLWRLTHGVEGHLEHRPVFREYWEAIRFLQNGQLIAAIVELHSLCERRSDTINLSALVDEVERDPDKSIASRSALAVAEASMTKIRILRNAALAHRTNKASYNDVFSTAAITPDEIAALIEVAIHVSIELLEALGEPAQELSPFPLETYDRMFRDLTTMIESE